jgi:hypothetical protein
MPNQGKDSLGREIAGLRRTFRAVDRLLKRFTPLLRETSGAATNGRTAVPRKLNLTPRRRRQLKQQGQYIGYMRNLKPKHKAEIKKLRQKRGMSVAIAKAKVLARS